MQDKLGMTVDKNDILFATKGMGMSYYIVRSFDDSLVLCQEVDKDFLLIKQVKGKKYRELNPKECYLHSKFKNSKYEKVL